MPEVLRIIGEESRRNATDKLTSRQIEETIKAYRAQKKSADASVPVVMFVMEWIGDIQFHPFIPIQ